MKVTEFFLGFGPKLWSFRRGETEYGIKLIPVVAYVRIIGMNNLDEVAPEDEPRTYRQQTFPRRMLVITAGSMMHFIQAFVLPRGRVHDRRGPPRLGAGRRRARAARSTGRCRACSRAAPLRRRASDPAT